ncbi:MAG: hypothetical protein M1825_002444 [Sarcosagium campestre]|nr:MAG: hypothetical protein M1825_002444 [Sarcosagium campestre]
MLSALHKIGYLGSSSTGLFNRRDQMTYRETVRALVEHGHSDPSIINSTGENGYDCIFGVRSLDYCADVKTWIIQSTRLFIDVERYDSGGMTMLMKMACQADLYARCIDILLHAGADINARSRPVLNGEVVVKRGGLTALHFALSSGCDTKLLLSRGADPHILSGAGNTPTTRILLKKDSFAHFLTWRDSLIASGHDLIEFVKDEMAALQRGPMAAKGCIEWVMQAFGFSTTSITISVNSLFLTYGSEKEMAQRNPDCTDDHGQYLVISDADESDDLSNLFDSDDESEDIEELEFTQNSTHVPESIQRHHMYHRTLAPFEEKLVKEWSTYRKYMCNSSDHSLLAAANTWWDDCFRSNLWWVDELRRYRMYSDLYEREA